MSNRYLGKMYVARASCGRVTAAGWADTKGILKDVRDWVKRGDSVSVVDRYENDPPLVWVCDELSDKPQQ